MHDAFGRLSEVHEYTDVIAGTAAITKYAYDSGDRVRRIENPDGVITELTHDFAGRRVSIVRAGRTWSYDYNKSGEMIAESAPPPSPEQAAAYTTTFAYDPAGRPLSRAVAPRGLGEADRALLGVGTILFTNDDCTNGVGRLCQVSYPGGVLSTSFKYDAEGNSTEESRSVLFGGVSGSFTTAASYGPGGKLVSYTYADHAVEGTRAQFEYDDRAMPRAVQWGSASSRTPRYVAVQTRNVAGLVTRRATSLGTAGWRDFHSDWTYDPLTRVTSQVIGDSLGTQLARQELDYYGQNDPKILRHQLGMTYYELAFGYDDRHQLTDVSEASSRFTAAYEFTPSGKLSRAYLEATAAPGGDVLNRDVSYEYGSPVDPEAVSALISLDGGGDKLRSYAYDGAGNMSDRSGATGSDQFTYDGENQLRRAVASAGGVAAGTEEYYYDHTGQRAGVVTRNAAGAVVSVRVFQGDTEVLLSGTGQVETTYAHLSLGTPVARVTNRTELELQYHGMASNLLLSVTPDGTTKSGFVYAPYGELLEATGTSTGEQRRRFNDKFRDDLTSLSYYGVRYYDGVLLGWTQADPLYRFNPEAAWTEPRRAQLYAFTLNNPLRYLDPDGRDPKATRVNVVLVDLQNHLSPKQEKTISRKVGASLRDAAKGDASLKGRIHVGFRSMREAVNPQKTGNIVVYFAGGVKGRPAAAKDLALAVLANEGTHSSVQGKAEKIGSDLAASEMHFRDRATNTAWVNLDVHGLPSTEAGLTALAGDAVHEGVGHRAGVEHDESGASVMSPDTKAEAKDSWIRFSPEDRPAVIDFFKNATRID